MSLIRPAFILDPANTGWLDRRGVLSRTHSAGARAAWLGADGVWRLVGPNVPRWIHDATTGRLVGLSVGEPGRTNLVTNPEGVGGTTGTFGSGAVAPTGWSQSSFTGNGVVVEYLGQVTIRGLPGTRWRLSGTPTATGGGFIQFQSVSGPTIAQHALNPYVQQSAGTGGISSISVRSGITGGTGSANSASFLATLGSFLPRNLLVTPGAGATALTGAIQVNYTSGVAIGNVQLDICAAQIELGGFSTTPIYPAAGGTGTATRNVEVLTFSLSRLGLVGIGTEGTLLLAARTSAVTGAAQTLASLTDGAGESLLLRRTAANLIQFDVSDGGVSQASLNDGVAVGASGEFTAVASWAPNSFTLTRAGAAEVSDAAGTVPVVTTLRLGTGDADAEPAGMALARLLLFPRQVAQVARLALAS